MLASFGRSVFGMTFHTWRSFRPVIFFSFAAWNFTLFRRGSMFAKTSVLFTLIYAIFKGFTSRDSWTFCRSRFACWIYATKSRSSSLNGSSTTVNHLGPVLSHRSRWFPERSVAACPQLRRDRSFPRSISPYRQKNEFGCHLRPILRSSLYIEYYIRPYQFVYKFLPVHQDLITVRVCRIRSVRDVCTQSQLHPGVARYSCHFLVRFR